jgi:hypothetical protein
MKKSNLILKHLKKRTPYESEGFFMHQIFPTLEGDPDFVWHNPIQPNVPNKIRSSVPGVPFAKHFHKVLTINIWYNNLCFILLYSLINHLNFKTMGFFSWMTQDTNKSIPSVHSSRVTFPVTMTDDKGNKWTEEDYEGYGVFGNKDYFELLAEMNGFTSDLKGDEYTDKSRSFGIDLAFKDNPHGKNPNVKHPNLTENPNHVWVNEIPESCPDQGFFYGSEDDEYDEEEDY